MMKEFGEKVQWFPVSIDQGAESKSKVIDQEVLVRYKIPEVPHLLIIDKESIIRFSGHPAEIDLR